MSGDDVDEWNIGLGYRRKIDTAENHIAGIYGFKDRREEYEHYWDMWTIGKKFTETNTVLKNVGVYIKLFRFFESDTPTMTGRQIRINKQFGNRDKITWKIGAQWRDDNIRGGETEATFTVSIPFGKGEAAGNQKDKTPSEVVETRMTEQPERDLDVVIGEAEVKNARSGEKITVENPASSGNIKVWYVKQGGEEGGDGSKESPKRIADVFTGDNNILNEGDIIVLKGKYTAESPFTSAVPLTFKENQQFISNNNDGGGAIIENPIGKGNLLFRPDIDNPGVIDFNPPNPALASGFNVLIANKKGNVVSGIVFNLGNNNGIETSLDKYNNIHINNNTFRFKNSDTENVNGIVVKFSEVLNSEQQKEIKSKYENNNDFFDFDEDNNQKVLIEQL